jgi:hypothetical protein
MKIKLAIAQWAGGKGSGDRIPWREQLDLSDVEGVEALSDEYAFDDLLEAVEEGAAGSGVTSVRRVATPTPNFHRHDAARKTAATSNWDSEFSNAQAHARDLLAKLGNA